ncbi:MAG: tetratricopeptide (TPR) repeat protein, partial [Planctomycetota bacterium]
MSTPSVLSRWFLPLALALGVAPLAAAESPGPLSPGPLSPGPLSPGEVQAEGQQSDAALKLAAIEFLAAGDYAAAQAILDQLTVRDTLVKAAKWIAEGQAREALQPLDHALKLQPGNAELMAMRGEAAYGAAAGDSQPGFFYEEAQGFFRDAVNAGVKANRAFGPEQLALILRASQAARRVPNPSVALEYATIAAAQYTKLVGEGVVFERFEVSLHQIWAEAAFDSYREAKGNQDEAASARLFLETEDQLERTLGERPSETWALEQLSNLYLWETRQDDARSALKRAVEIDPGNAALQEKAFRMVWDQLGADEAVNYATRLRTSWPESPFGYWYGGSAEFYRALTAFLAEESVRDVEAFQRAEAFFARCRELEPNYAGSALNYEVTCRAAVGWCYYNEDKKEAARDAFLSTGELFEGGLSVTVDNRLPNGLAGLTFIAAKFAEDPRSVEGQDQAAEIAWTVFQT